MFRTALLIRADASPEIGVGHIMRCLAIAQAWRTRGGAVLFALAEGANDLEDRIRAEGAEVARVQGTAGSLDDATQTVRLFASLNAGWIVLDGYHFSTDYLRQISTQTRPLLLMDDGEVPRRLPCNIVVNTNPYATNDLYRDGEWFTQYLVGPKYALLRREFVESVRDDSIVPPTAKRVLITLGGGDAENVTLQVLEAFQGVKDIDLELTVVVGASNPNISSLEIATRKISHKVTIRSDVRDMPGLMRNADLAITAGGGTCYELAFMRVPMLLITTATNHEKAVAYFNDSRVAYTTGWFNTLSPATLAASLRQVICDCALREKVATNARRMVDGKGAERVVDVMFQLSLNRQTEIGT